MVWKFPVERSHPSESRGTKWQLRCDKCTLLSLWVLLFHVSRNRAMQFADLLGAGLEYVRLIFVETPFYARGTIISASTLSMGEK
jgi:hypothetical protein